MPPRIKLTRYSRVIHPKSKSRNSGQGRRGANISLRPPAIRKFKSQEKRASACLKLLETLRAQTQMISHELQNIGPADRLVIKAIYETSQRLSLTLKDLPASDPLKKSIAKQAAGLVLNFQGFFPKRKK